LLRREARRTPGAIGPKYVDVTDQYLGTLATSSGAVLRWSTILRLEFSDGDIYYSTGSGGMALLPSRAFDSVDGAQYAFQQKIGFRDEAVRVRLAKFGLRFRLRRSTRIHFQESVQTWMPIKR